MVSHCFHQPCIEYGILHLGKIKEFPKQKGVMTSYAMSRIQRILAQLAPVYKRGMRVGNLQP